MCLSYDLALCSRGSPLDLCRPVQDDLAPVGAVYLGDLRTELPLEPLHAEARSVELVLQPQDLLDPCQVESELGREALDEAEPIHVGVRVEPRAARRAARAHEALRLV